MPSQKPDDELKFTRRLFLQHAAATTAATTLYSVAMKTDAIAQQAPQVAMFGFGPGDGMPYPYLGP